MGIETAVKNQIESTLLHYLHRKEWGSVNVVTGKHKLTGTNIVTAKITGAKVNGIEIDLPFLTPHS